jgi:predicted nucleic acid-binding protein
LILYLDTSALVKLYAEEEGTETVERAVDEAEAVATSVVAYAEARAAFARKLREDVFSQEKHQEAVEALDEDWETLDKPEVSEDLVREAGDRRSSAVPGLRLQPDEGCREGDASVRADRGSKRPDQILTPKLQRRSTNSPRPARYARVTLSAEQGCRATSCRGHGHLARATHPR